LATTGEKSETAYLSPFLRIIGYPKRAEIMPAADAQVLDINAGTLCHCMDKLGICYGRKKNLSDLPY